MTHKNMKMQNLKTREELNESDQPARRQLFDMYVNLDNLIQTWLDYPTVKKLVDEAGYHPDFIDDIKKLQGQLLRAQKPLDFIGRVLQ